MTPDHALSDLLTRAARRARNDGRFEVQPALDGAPFRPVDVGPIADLLTTAASEVALYEGRGWDEKTILERVSEMVRQAVALAQKILGPGARS